MTIKRNPNYANEPYNVRLDPEELLLFPEHEIPLLTQTGLAIFRHVDVDKLQPVIDNFSSITSKFRTVPRGEHPEKPHALTQIELEEPKHEKVSSFLGHIATDDVQDDIFQKVFSLREKLEVTTDKRNTVSIVGNLNSEYRTVAITFDYETTLRLNNERLSILRCIENHSNGVFKSDRWFRRPTPHISLGKIYGDIKDSELKKMRLEFRELIPETLVLNRAGTYSIKPEPIVPRSRYKKL